MQNEKDEELLTPGINNATTQCFDGISDAVGWSGEDRKRYENLLMEGIDSGALRMAAQEHAINKGILESRIDAWVEGWVEGWIMGRVEGLMEAADRLRANGFDEATIKSLLGL